MSRRGDTGIYPKSNGDRQLTSNNSCNPDPTQKNFEHNSLLPYRWTPSGSARVLLGYIDEPRRKLNTIVAKLSNVLPKSRQKHLN